MARRRSKSWYISRLVRASGVIKDDVVTTFDSDQVAAIVNENASGGDVNFISSGGANNLFTVGNEPSSLTGSFNIGLGYQALDAVTTGPGNIAIGANALSSITTGDYNVAIGINTNDASSGDNYNVSIGYNAHGGASSFTGCVAIGYNAGLSQTDDYGVAIGYAAGDLGGQGQIAIGYNALGNSTTSGDYNVAIGYGAGQDATTGDYNILIGYNAETTVSTSSNQCILGARSSTGMISYLQVGTYMTMSTGTLTMSGNVTAYSDARLKTNVETVSGLDNVTKMRGVTFQKDGEQSTGVIAQELLEVAPELVIIPKGMDEENQYYSVNYSGLSGYFIEAIKEQQKQIEELKEEIKKLKGE